MERSREYLIEAINKRDPNVLRDIVDTLDARLSFSATKQKMFDATRTIHQKIQLVSWANIIGKPATFPPSAHTHPEYISEETDPIFSASPAADITAEQVDAMNEMLLDRRAWGGEWGYIWENP